MEQNTSRTASTAKVKSPQTFPKPNAFVYRLVAFFSRIFLRLKLRPTYKTEELRRIKGPAVILCSHSSNLDFLAVAVALLPLRPTYIMSNHFFTHPKISKLLRPLHAIPKKMFCADVNAIRQILKAANSGNVIVMFAEGRLSCCGHTVQPADGTAELLKKLGVDVYWLTENGVYKSLPKWGKAGIRRGPISIEGGKLFDGAELSCLSISQIKEKISAAIEHDDETAFVGERYKCKKPALGLDGILYKCPVCGEEFHMTSDDTTLSCLSCGASWTLDEQYVLHRNDACTGNAQEPAEDADTLTASAKEPVGPDFTSINAWFDWEQDCIDLSAGLETECILATPDARGITDRNAGKGVISITPEEIHFVGDCFGEPLEFTEKNSMIKAFPATVGDHFDIYSERIMYNFIPQPIPASAIKWVQYLDKWTSEDTTK